MSRTSFRVNLHPIVYLNVKELLACQGTPVTYVSPYARMWSYKHHLFFQLVTREIFGKKKKRKEKKKKKMKKNLYFKFVDSEKFLV